jgi:hypothetical protein
MPIHRKIDKFGSYFQYGNHGKKYYYLSNNKKSRHLAYNKAKKQMIAIYSNHYFI